MSVSDLAIVAALVFGWGTLSARLERFDVTAPITFVLAGLLLTHGPLAFLSVAPSKELIKELAELTLALVLFSDASRVGLHELRVDEGLYLRLLGAALPLTIGLGTLLALALDRSDGIWLALLVGAALAPTDAALGAGMMANPAIPARIPLPTTPPPSSPSPSCSALSPTAPPPIRSPPGTRGTSPVRQASVLVPKYPAYRSAGSSAGPPTVAKPGQFTHKRVRKPWRAGGRIRCCHTINGIRTRAAKALSKEDEKELQDALHGGETTAQ